MISYSTDASDWQELKILPKADEKQRGKFSEAFVFPIEADIRYLRVEAKNYGSLPDWHEAAGSEAWLFVDEIIVR